MKICIGFFGLPRNTDRTFSSIRENILQPAAEFGTVLPCYHLYKQTHVLNPRSLENSELDPSQYQPFSELQGELESPDKITEKWGFTEISARGDAWSDGLYSLRNLLLQLHSLAQVTQQLESFDPDIVVFIRPDLRYHQSFSSALKQITTSKNEKTVWLPFWQWAGGYNDRFAICTKDAFSAYGRRIKAVDAYLRSYTKRPLHAERLLMFALDHERIKVRRLNVQATRVRVSGLEVEEDFSRVQANRLVRWAARELRKSTVEFFS